jgi:hypothetical protein
MTYVVDPTLVGKKYKFDDGDSIEVTQIKERSEQYHLVTVLIYQGPGIPRKLVFHYEEFQEYYGHLFRATTKRSEPKPVISV